MNTTGETLRVSLFGQSHAPMIGALIEGLPAGIRLDMDAISAFMARRAPGKSETATARRETDLPRIISGLNDNGETCGAPLCAVIENGDTRSKDYSKLRDLPRPGHADYTAFLQSGSAHDIRGGGQFSGRLTAPLCFAGAVCMQLPALKDVVVGAHLLSVGNVRDDPFSVMGMDKDSLHAITQRPLPTLSDDACAQMQQSILSAKNDSDSLGGIVEAIAMNVPQGLGSPMFSGVENKLAQLIFGIPAVRGVEFGAGFAAAHMRGSAHNDPFAVVDGQIKTTSNNHGGILGGITTGMPLIVRAAIKPTPSIGIEQQTVSLSEMTEQPLVIDGRHDPCIAPRAVPVIEAAIWIVLADMVLGKI